MIEADNDDTVLVSEGTYNEAVDFLHKKIFLLSESGAQFTFIEFNADTPVVKMENIPDSGAVIEGFTITNPYNPPGSSQRLHGIKCVNSSSIIRDNLIRDIGNNMSTDGAGIYAVGSRPVIEGNIITNNECVYYGGGIYLGGCDTAVVSNNTISQNRTYSGYGFAYGGGMCIVNSMVSVHHNVFDGNWADPNYACGGAICIRDSSIVSLFNNTFYNNQGHCVYITSFSTTHSEVTAINNIIANTNGVGFYLAWGNLNCNYNDYHNNTQGDHHNCSAGDNDIFEDPLFTFPQQGIFELQEDSPCIDAGDPTSPLDPDSTIADLGAFYYDQTVGVEEQLKIKNYELKIISAYPNPFNSTTSISFTLPYPTYLEVSVYDLLGRKVMEVFRGDKPAGMHIMQIEGNDLASGVYFIKLIADGRWSMAKKVVLLK